MAFVFAGYIYEPAVGLKFGAQDVALPPKERALLHFLLCAGGKVVSKDELVREIWRGGVASDESLSRAVYRLRLAMQAAGGPPVVATVYNAGFRIAVDIVEQASARDADVALPAFTRRRRQVWALLLSGREFAARMSPQDLAAALCAVQAALALDESCVPAWIALAEMHVLQAMRGALAPRQAGALAQYAAQRALTLRPACGPGLAIRGWVRAMVQGELQNGLRDINLALQQDASYWSVYWLRAWVMQAVGEHEEAVSMARQAQAGNACSLFFAAVLPQQLLYAGRFAEALEVAQLRLQQFPGVDSVQEIMSIILCRLGRLDDALAPAQRAAQLAPDCPLMLGQLAYVLARLQRVDEVRALLLQMQMQLPGRTTPHTAIAVVRMALGERAGARRSLQAAKAHGLPQLFGMRDDPRLHDASQDADFRDLWQV